MKQKLFIFGALFFLIIILIGLNAASYVQKPKIPDTEFAPNRTSFNSGSTGTRAFYDLLNETGRKVTRWQEPPEALLDNKNAPKTFVIVGSLKREFSENDATQLLRWVSGGGKLIVIDRNPSANLLTTTANWKISIPEKEPNLDLFNIDPSDTAQITDKVEAAKPIQPTIYTKNVNAIQPSKFLHFINFERFKDGEKPKNQTGSGSGTGIGSSAPPPPIADDEYFSEEQLKATPTPKTEKPPSVFKSENTNSAPKIETQDKPAVITTAAEQPDNPEMNAPVVHFANSSGNLVVDVPFGAGRIVYLSDPFIVSNAGINLVDNAQLGINLLTSRDGLIAFDEYHQGFGTNNNRFFQYFEGTPVIAIFLQIALLIALFLFSQSRRFARAVPDYEPNRLSKLEYVSAMAELQQRTKAFDLAIENIYADFRRRTSRMFGVDNFTVTHKELANLIAERARLDRNEIEELLFKCEDIVQGEKTNKKEVVQLASRLREIEEKIGLQRQKRRRDVV